MTDDTKLILSKLDKLTEDEYDEEGVALGEWCSKQRRNENLEPDRRKKLELVGFRFIKKKENEEKKINLCAEYGIDYKKYKSLKSIPYQELYAKIQFLIHNGYFLELDGELHEIFVMCNQNMQVKYNINKEQLIMDYYINIKERGV